MTWKRVATALVLIPVVVGLVLFTPTWVVAIATAAITVLALWEYFALGEAIGHRAYRVWTVFCAVLFMIQPARFDRPVFYFTAKFPGEDTLAPPSSYFSPVPLPRRSTCFIRRPQYFFCFCWD